MDSARHSFYKLTSREPSESSSDPPMPRHTTGSSALGLSTPSEGLTNGPQAEFWKKNNKPRDVTLQIFSQIFWLQVTSVLPITIFSHHIFDGMLGLPNNGVWRKSNVIAAAIGGTCQFADSNRSQTSSHRRGAVEDVPRRNQCCKCAERCKKKIWICIHWHSNFPTCRNASCFSTAAPSVANHALSRAWGKSRKWPCFKSIDKHIPHYSKSLSFLVSPYAWQMTRQDGCAGIKRWRVGNRCGSKNIATLTRCHLANTLQMEFHRRLVHRTSPDWLKRETLDWREPRLCRRFHKMVNTEFLNFHSVSSFRFILCACFAGRKSSM